MRSGGAGTCRCRGQGLLLRRGGHGSHLPGMSPRTDRGTERVPATWGPRGRRNGLWERKEGGEREGLPPPRRGILLPAGAKRFLLPGMRIFFYGAEGSVLISRGKIRREGFSRQGQVGSEMRRRGSTRLGAALPPGCGGHRLVLGRGRDGISGCLYVLLRGIRGAAVLSFERKEIVRILTPSVPFEFWSL